MEEGRPRGLFDNWLVKPAYMPLSPPLPIDYNELLWPSGRFSSLSARVLGGHRIDLSIPGNRSRRRPMPGAARLSATEACIQLLPRGRPRTVRDAGAPAGSVLRGSGFSNRGVRLRVLEGQPPGADGSVRGAFVLLDVGDNRHSQALEAFLGVRTDAAEVLAAIRGIAGACVNVANTNILVAESGGQAPEEDRYE
jgi:hypothetical protein